MVPVSRVSKAIGAAVGFAVAWALDNYALVDFLSPEIQNVVIQIAGVVTGVYVAPKNSTPEDVNA